jgi:ABC-type multidrug transport system fused ATPase/permease subunit
MVLNGVDLRVAPGQQVALVGLSGSGKSTIIQLLLRFYDARSGRITFNGHDVTAVNLRWLRRMMGVVGQEPPLFSVNLRQNIAYADASLTDADVAAAAGLACATEFIEAMPDKYDTLVGPKGVQLSGGTLLCVSVHGCASADMRVSFMPRRRPEAACGHRARHHPQPAAAHPRRGTHMRASFFV